MQLHGNAFENSPVCKGVGYTAEGASMDIAKIALTGRYPEQGWIMNEISYELVYVLDGIGKFIQEGEEDLQIGEGDVISISAGKKYAWDGALTLIVACNPPFDPKQHKLLEEV